MWAWGGLFALGLVLEARALRQGKVTLSSCTRQTFQVHHPAGKAAFGGFWLWYLIHIVGHKRTPAV